MEEAIVNNNQLSTNEINNQLENHEKLAEERDKVFEISLNKKIKI